MSTRADAVKLKLSNASTTDMESAKRGVTRPQARWKQKDTHDDLAGALILTIGSTAAVNLADADRRQVYHYLYVHASLTILLKDQAFRKLVADCA